MVPAFSLGAFFAGVIGLVLASGDIAVSRSDLIVLAGLGAGQSAVATILMTLAARHVRAAEVNLLIMIETVLAPLWVWLAVGETPSTMTLVGGTIVLVSVSVFAVVNLTAAIKAAEG